MPSQPKKVKKQKKIKNKKYKNKDQPPTVFAMVTHGQETSDNPSNCCTEELV